MACLNYITSLKICNYFQKKAAVSMDTAAQCDWKGGRETVTPSSRLVWTKVHERANNDSWQASFRRLRPSHACRRRPCLFRGLSAGVVA